MLFSDGKHRPTQLEAELDDKNIRLFRWKAPQGVELLILFRYTGGMEGYQVDAFRVNPDVKQILDSPGNDFRATEPPRDLNFDGLPEIICLSYALANFGFPDWVSNGASPYGLAVLSLENGKSEFRNLSDKFPEVLNPHIEQAEARFLNEWPGKRKISSQVLFPSTTSSLERVACNSLKDWAIHLCYAGRACEARATLRAHADKVTANVIWNVIHIMLERDYGYVIMPSEHRGDCSTRSARTKLPNK